jgi:uncharacterized protein (DUF58 family)
VIGQAISAWLEFRLPRSDSHTLNQGNIYIVPTRAGFAFAITLIVMLLASINYQLNLGYLLTFLLAGSAGVSLHLTHATLRALTLHIKPPQPVFLGEAAVLQIVLSNPGRERYGIGLAVRDARPFSFAWCDVPAGGSAHARVSFVPQRRGLNDLPTLIAETRFPLGLFRAWTLWRPASKSLAWPRPEQPAAPLPAGQPISTAVTMRSTNGGSEYDGVRSYRRGDALRSVVWKKVAKSGELVSRDTGESTSRELWLDFDGTHLADAESRLSRLAAWALAANKLGLSFGLRLPGVELAPATGETQRRAALDALALWS